MRPIRLTPDFLKNLQTSLLTEMQTKLNLDELTKAAEDALGKLKLTDGVFRFQKDFKFERKFELKSERRATLRILPEAMAKIMLIVMSNDKEVAWHCTTERVSSTEFIVKDVLIYPQQVTAVTVDTDDAEYAQWLIKIGEERFSNLHAQMHSHVNMPVSPSTTDLGHRSSIVAQMKDHDYYIFMIWNKSLVWSAAIYDMPSNTLYETDDVDVIVEFSDGTTAGEVIQDLKDKVAPYKYQPKTYTPPAAGPGTAYTTDVKKNGQKSWWEEERERRAAAAAAKGVSEIGNGLGDFRGSELYAGLHALRNPDDYDWC